MKGAEMLGEFLGGSLLIWAGALVLHRRGAHTLDTVFVGIGGAVVVVWGLYRAYQYVPQDSPDAEV